LADIYENGRSAANGMATILMCRWGEVGVEKGKKPKNVLHVFQEVKQYMLHFWVVPYPISDDKKHTTSEQSTESRSHNVLLQFGTVFCRIARKCLVGRFCPIERKNGEDFEPSVP